MAQANRITRFGADIDLVSRRLLLVAGSAAATNCLLELKKDAVTARTPARLLPRGRLGPADLRRLRSPWELPGLRCSTRWPIP